jgi:hypothetical protein
MYQNSINTFGASKVLGEMEHPPIFMLHQPVTRSFYMYQNSNTFGSPKVKWMQTLLTARDTSLSHSIAAPLMILVVALLKSSGKQVFKRRITI